MTLAELMKIVDYGTEMELHDAKDGKLVASTSKGLEKYKDIELMGFKPHLKFSNKDRYANSFASVKAVMYVWGLHYDIERIRENGK